MGKTVRSIASFCAAAMVACGLCWHSDANAVHKCVVDGKISYQEHPCEGQGETVRQAMAREAQDERQRLVEASVEAESRNATDTCWPSLSVSMSKLARRHAHEECSKRRAREDTARKNAESLKQFNQIMSERHARGGAAVASTQNRGNTPPEGR
jgi:hypothetical protein